MLLNSLKMLFGGLFLSIFLTGGLAKGQTSQRPLAKPLVGAAESLRQGSKEQNLEMLRHLQRLSSGGSIQGGGGGGFQTSLFWATVRSVVSRVDDPNMFAALDKPRIDALMVLMKNPRAIALFVVDRPLYAKDSSGQAIPVDALNFPEQRAIVLNGPAWEKHYASGLETRHLVLHEFLGLARIDDTRFNVSQRYFPPTQKPLPFAWNTLKCQSNGYFLYHSENNYLFSQEFAESAGKDDLSGALEEKTIGTERSFCKDLSDRSENCFYKDGRRKVKTTQMTGEFTAQRKEFFKEIPNLRRYFTKIDVTVSEDSKSYGWGAAAQSTFANDANFALAVQVIAEDPTSRRKQVLAVAEAMGDKLDKYGNFSVSTTLVNPELISAMSEAGISLSLAKNGRDGYYLLNAQNISDLLTDYAMSRGARNQKEIDGILAQTLFRGLSPTVPLYVDVSCSFKP